jgi:hypothetical protein
MTRRLVLALLLLAAAPAAPAADAPKPPALPARVVAVPLGADPQANRRALQAAHDALAALSPPGGTIAILPGDWTIAGSVQSWGDRIRWRGPGRESCRIASVGGFSPVFVLGMPPTNNGARLTPDHFVVAAGTLDETLTGRRWGFRTKGDAHIAQQAGPFAFAGRGDYYGKTNCLTLDVALDLSRIPATQENLSLCGLSRQQFPSPWKLWWVGPAGGGPTYWLSFRTADGKVWHAQVADPSTAGIDRLSITIDLAAGKALAWLNGAQVAVPDLGPAFAASAATGFWPNTECPFLVGASGISCVGVTDYQGQAGDWTLWGLSLSAGRRYADDGTGTPQRRPDGAPMDDGTRFFKYFLPEVIAQVALSDAPDAACANRVVTATGGGYGLPNFTTAHVLDNAIQEPRTVGQTVEGLTIAAPQDYGVAVQVGGALQVRIRDCDLSGAQAIGSLNFGAIYPVAIDDCTLAGTDAAVHLWQTTAQISRVVTRGGRTMLRLVDSQASVADLFTVEAGRESAIEGSGWLRATEITVDSESPGLLSKAVIRWSTSPVFTGSLGGLVQIDLLSVGTVPAGTPLLDLATSPWDVGRPALVKVGAVGVFGPVTPAVARASKSWRGSVDPAGCPPGVPLAIGDGAARISAVGEPGLGPARPASPPARSTSRRPADGD